MSLNRILDQGDCIGIACRECHFWENNKCIIMMISDADLCDSDASTINVNINYLQDERLERFNSILIEKSKIEIRKMKLERIVK